MVAVLVAAVLAVASAAQELVVVVLLAVDYVEVFAND